MIKVLYIVSTLKKSGPSNQLYNLLKYLDRNNIEPVIITLSPEPEETLLSKIELLNISIISLNLSRIQGMLRGKFLLRKRVNKIRPDIIQTHGIRSDSMALKNLNKIPIITVVRCYPSLDYPLRYGRIIGTIMVKKHMSVINNSRHPVGCSESVALELSKNKKHPIRFIQNGVDFEIYKTISAKEKKIKRKQFQLPTEKPIFIFTGNLNSIKNIETLILAFKILNKDDKFILLLVGKGPEKEKLELIANNDESILFIGFKPNVLDYLHVSDYFISSSTAEGLPNSVIEAMACGLPPILSDIPSHRELFKKIPEYNYFFPVGNIQKAAECLTNIIDDNYNKLSKNITQLIENDFNANAMSQKYQDLYQQIYADKIF